MSADLTLLPSGDEAEEAEEFRKRRREWDADEEAKRRMLEAEIGFVVGVQSKARMVGLGVRKAADKRAPKASRETTKPMEALAARLARNTARKADPFGGFARVPRATGI